MTVTDNDGATWGGKREGAGRKPTVPGGFSENCNVRLTMDQKQFLIDTHGGVTVGMRALIDAAMGAESSAEEGSDYEGNQG